MIFGKRKITEKQQHQKISFSQSGEDLIIDFFFTARQIHQPSYIDIGSYHPYKINNTALFYEKGARGINIEPNPEGYDKFLEFRPDDINLNIGVGKMDSSMLYYLTDSPTLNTFSKEEVERYEEKKVTKLIETKEIKIKTLSSVISEYADGVFPDFLTLDVEGWDYDILESLSELTSKPKLVCVETYSYTEGNIYKEKFDSLMSSLDYTTYGSTTINTIYVRTDFY